MTLLCNNYLQNWLGSVSWQISASWRADNLSSCLSTSFATAIKTFLKKPVNAQTLFKPAIVACINAGILVPTHAKQICELSNTHKWKVAWHNRTWTWVSFNIQYDSKIVYYTAEVKKKKTVIIVSNLQVQCFQKNMNKKIVTKCCYKQKYYQRIKMVCYGSMISVSWKLDYSIIE